MKIKSKSLKQQTASILVLSMAASAGINGCGTSKRASSTLNATSDSPIQDWNDAMATLKGYDLLNGYPKGDCVKSPNLEDAATGANGNISTFSVQYISDAEELHKAMNVSASAKFSALGGGGASAKAAYASQLNVNQYSVYAVVSVNVQKSTKMYRNVSMKDAIAKFLEDPNFNADQFRKRCGDRFIVGQKTGGEFTALLEIKASSRSEKEDIAVKVKGNSGVWNASANFSSSLQKLNSQYSLSFKAFKAGGENNPMPATADLLINRALGFEAEVDGRSVPTVAILQEYETTDNWPFVSPVDVLSSVDVIEQLNRTRLTINSNRANISYVLENRSQFKEIKEGYLSEKMNLLNDAYNKVLDAARNCGRDYKNCALPTNLPDIQVDLPAWQEKGKIIGEHPSCGIEEYNTSAGEACGIESETFKNASGAACGIVGYVYNSKRDESCGLENAITSAAVCGTREYSYVPTPETFTPEMDRCKAQGGNIVITSWEKGAPYICKDIPKTCGDPSKGPIYKECTRDSFGVKETLYNTCRDPSFGRESVTYKTCANPAFGVKKYKTCSHD